MAELAHWDSFCVIVGSAAGALIGLQFVVLTLIAEHPPVDTRAGFAFASPTIVHFSAVLLTTVLMRMPWQGLTAVAALWTLLGFLGVVYVLVVMRRMHAQEAYKPDVEDWLFHVVLPIAGYGTLVICALAMPSHESSSLFGVAAAALILLFTAIHNAWDAVAYHVLVAGAGRRKS